MSNNRHNKNFRKTEREVTKFDFVEKGYTNKEGVLREELLTIEAREIAKILYENGKGLSNSQLRAFFNEVKAIKNRIDDNEDLFIKNYPFILMLKSKAEYKYRNGKNSKITKEFRDFINASVDYIKKNKSLETFNNFCLFFETIVGYFYGFGGVR